MPPKQDNEAQLKDNGGRSEHHRMMKGRLEPFYQANGCDWFPFPRVLPGKSDYSAEKEFHPAASSLPILVSMSIRTVGVSPVNFIPAYS